MSGILISARTIFDFTQQKILENVDSYKIKSDKIVASLQILSTVLS